MGKVYMAQHPVIGRKTAVKILHPELARNEVVVARFMNEARAANAIGHPNIIDIIDAGLLPEDGVPFLQMEFLEGESLAARLSREHHLEVELAVDFACQTALALQAAHDKGIVHRDLKPDNLFVVQDRLLTHGERVKVLDFGIAKLCDDFRGDSIRTQSGSVLGTATYMSPEQCQGLVDLIDFRSDIYSLGIILYELLTGAPPFVYKGFADLVIAHMTGIPVDPRETNPGIPARVADAILRAIQKKPEDRFPSMNDLRTAVAGVADQSVTPKPHRSPPLDSPEHSPQPRNRSADTTLRRSAIEAVEETSPASYRTPYKLYGALAAGAAVLGTVLLLLLTRPSAPEKAPETHPAARPTKRLPIQPIVIEREADPIPLPEPSAPGKAQEEPNPKQTPTAVPAVPASAADKKDRAHRNGPAREKAPSGKASRRSPEEDPPEEEVSAERW
jgi:serine/threonine protein kinase